MTYVTKTSLASLEGNKSFTSPLDGKYHCVALVQAITNAPLTSAWRKGIKVLDAKQGSIKRGTAIATFNENGKYPPGDKDNKHAAIYVSHNENGITVYDQFIGQDEVKMRTIRRKNLPSLHSDDANYYYVIERE